MLITFNNSLYQIFQHNLINFSTHIIIIENTFLKSLKINIQTKNEFRKRIYTFIFFVFLQPLWKVRK